MTLWRLPSRWGIVIDDAIVVLENIFRYIEEKNCSTVRRGDTGHARGRAAVMATTLSMWSSSAD